MKRYRVYLAGPEVFLPDALSAGRRKVDLCAAAGFEGVFPLDPTLDLTSLDKAGQALRIYRALEAMMLTCDLLIANMTPFRGVSMDAGTAFEMGFMRALGRPVLGYSNVTDDYRTRALVFRQRGIPPGDCDGSGIEIEDLDGADNLMMAVAARESGAAVFTATAPAGEAMTHLGAFEQCLAAARRIMLPKAEEATVPGAHSPL